MPAGYGTVAGKEQSGALRNPKRDVPRLPGKVFCNAAVAGEAENGPCAYVRSNMMQSMLFKKFVITYVDCDPFKNHHGESVQLTS